MSRGHGERWEALLGTLDGVTDRLRRMVPMAEILPRSDLQTAWCQDNPEAADYSILAWPKERLRMAVVLRREHGEQANEVISAFPLMDAEDSPRLELLSMTPDDNHGEAELVMLLRDGREITLFDPLFVLHREDLQKGRQYAVALSGLAYTIKKADRSFRVTEGPMLDEERRRVAAKDPAADVSAIHSVDVSLDHMRYLNPRDDTESDAEFFMKAEQVGWFIMDDIPICRMVGLVTHQENGKPIRLTVYASKHVLQGYDPAPGDLLNGVIWLQGVPLRRMRQTECWADRVLPESPQAFFEAHKRGEEAEAKFPNAHPGVRAFVSALGQTGWAIEPLANSEPVECGVCLSMRQDDHEIRVWVRAFHEGMEQDCAFTQEEEQRLTPAGLPCAFVTVKCEDAGTHLRLSYTGHETIEALTGDLRLLVYIRKPGALDSEAPDDQEGG